MIFPPKVARLILRGGKTQTRVPVRYVATDDIPETTTADRRRNPRGYVDVDYPNKVMVACPFRPEQDYSLQLGRGKDADPRTRLFVTSVSDEPQALGAITQREAMAEGHLTTDEFFEAWEARYGELDKTQLVWVVTFTTTTAGRFMTDNRDPHKGSLDVVYLPPAAGGMNHEPQLVPEEFEDQEATLARGRDEIREVLEHPERVGERDLLRKQNKLRKLQAEARRHRIDITPELDRAIAAVQHKIATTRRAA